VQKFKQESGLPYVPSFLALKL